MNYDTMTIESLANECFEQSGYKINKSDLESRIKHLCEKYHQDKLKNESLHLVSCSDNKYCEDCGDYVKKGCDNKQCNYYKGCN